MRDFQLVPNSHELLMKEVAMNELNHQIYYELRAETSRDLARRALSPAIAAIHSDFAVRYENLAASSERQNEDFGVIVQAT